METNGFVVIGICRSATILYSPSKQKHLSSLTTFVPIQGTPLYLFDICLKAETSEHARRFLINHLLTSDFQVLEIFCVKSAEGITTLDDDTAGYVFSTHQLSSVVRRQDIT